MTNMVDQTEITDNTGRAVKKPSSKYNVTNPTKTNHVINGVNNKRVLIPAGEVVENVELYDDEAQAMKDILKKTGDGKFISLKPAGGVFSSGGEQKEPEPIKPSPAPSKK